MTTLKVLIMSLALAISGSAANAATLALEVSFDLLTTRGPDSQGLNGATVLFRADFAENTLFTRDFNAAPRAVAASHSFTISNSNVDGVYTAAAGTVGLFASNGNFDGIFNSTANSFINGDAFPIGIAGIASQLRFDAGNTIPDAALGDTLTLAQLQSAVFGSGGLQILSQSGSGSSGYALNNFSSRAFAVGAPSAVPLPAAFPLLLGGLGAFGLIRARGRKRKDA